MNEDLLYTLNQQPDPAFADALRERLRRQPSAVQSTRWPGRRFLATAAAVILIAGAFSLPGVRASAETFLSLFRMVNLVAVPVTSQNATTLASQQLDLPRLLSHQVQMIQQPGAPVAISSVEGAGSYAGFTVAQPTFLPAEETLDQIEVQGTAAVQATIDTTILQDMLQALAINDLDVPPEANGQTMMLKVSPVVHLSYTAGTRWVRLHQARPPEVELPASLDLPRLGEIVLRILGVPASDAHTFAQQIDWHSTLLLPIPPNAVRFQQVDINGHNGVQVETATPARRVTILWATGDRVFALEGNVPTTDLFQMALSIR